MLRSLLPFPTLSAESGLEVAIATTGNRMVVNSRALLQAASGMASLKVQFPKLRIFSIFLAVNVSNVRDDTAKA